MPRDQNASKWFHMPSKYHPNDSKCRKIPVQMLPTIVDPDTFQPRKGLITRYGKTAISPSSRWYRIIRLVGADSRYLTSPFGTMSTSFA